MKTNSKTVLAEFSKTIDLVYQGATDIEVWPKITQKICDWLGAKTCVIFTPQFPHYQDGFAITHQFNDIGLYDTKFNAHNIWELRAYELSLMTTGSIICDILN